MNKILLSRLILGFMSALDFWGLGFRVKTKTVATQHVLFSTVLSTTQPLMKYDQITTKLS